MAKQKSILQAIMILSIALSFLSCQSKEKKAEELIKERMFETAFDFDSYQPISTSIEETHIDIFSNLECIEAAKGVLELFNSGRYRTNSGGDELNKQDQLGRAVSYNMTRFLAYMPQERKDTVVGYTINH